MARSDTRWPTSDCNSRWAYDTQYADASACANAKGRLCEASTTNGYSRKLAYDSLGRPASTTTRADVAGGTGTYQDDLSYNARGLVATPVLADTAGLGIRHFSYAFRNATGPSPHQYLLHRRVEQAKELIRQGSRSPTWQCRAASATRAN